MDWTVFFKEYPLFTAIAAGFVGIILGVVLTRWNDSQKKSKVQNREIDERVSLHNAKIKEATELVNTFDSVIHDLTCHIEELVAVIKAEDADQIPSEFHKLNQFRLRMRSLLAESKGRLADIALLNDRALLELFLTLADSARTVSDEAQAIPGEYAYGDSAFADTRLKKLEDLLAESMLSVKSIRGRIEALAGQNV